MNIRQNSFSYLLVALVLLLVGNPIVDDMTGWDTPTLRAITVSIVLILGIGSLTAHRRVLWLGVALMIIGVVLNGSAAIYETQALSIAALVFFLAFLLVMTGTALHQIVLATDISWNRIMGAVCVYLLLGSLWAVIYLLLYALAPDSFAGIDPPLSATEFQYFSFVTLTTLGFGDITPVTATAKAFVVLEAIVGQLYIAIMIAGLVGAYIAKPPEQR